MCAQTLIRRAAPWNKAPVSQILNSQCWTSRFRPGARSYVTTNEWSTPLAKTISEAIKTTGPISIAAYMRQCLTSPKAGYYTSDAPNREHIGRKGDFVTSPEISQVFGKPSSGVELIEFGPGKGTLIADILRTVRRFEAMNHSIDCIYLVEASENLRLKQCELLCGKDTLLEEVEIGWRGQSMYSKVPIIWCEDVKFIPNDPKKTPLIIAHEFFDALPIQAFQSVPPASDETGHIQGLHGPIKLTKGPPSSQTSQWRELLVTNVEPAVSYKTASRPAQAKSLEKPAEFQLSLAKASNPSSLLIPESSPRYRALKHKPDSVIEISPESHAHAAEFARRIGGFNSGLHQQKGSTGSLTTKTSPSGAALIIDYGTANTIPTSTLRGIKSHTRVSPFSSPGEVDLSADVDFTALAEAAIEASEGVEVHGPVDQGDWLQMMGIHERAKALSAKATDADDGEDTVRKIQASVRRLVEKGGGSMGKVYKVMAIVPESGGQRPVGFGGSVP